MPSKEHEFEAINMINQAKFTTLLSEIVTAAVGRGRMWCSMVAMDPQSSLLLR